MPSGGGAGDGDGALQGREEATWDERLSGWPDLRGRWGQGGWPAP